MGAWRQPGAGPRAMRMEYWNDDARTPLICEKQTSRGRTNELWPAACGFQGAQGILE
ncbi:hypothetical protein D1AOALGA4SA_12215 [Olavius algarvensis Delta 1 endosymbiont]|nr:hypothetical protein D1AOALGA4SA_12215 [Olavius algarvensis Delta 1 endosymbiont]